MQRGRKSPDAIAASINVTGKPPRLTAPSSLTTAERTLFNELIAGSDSSHFRSTDIPLLISFIQATRIAQASAHDPDKIAIWEKATRVQATLATRLRLAPQARTDPKSLGRQELYPGLRKPWETITREVAMIEEEVDDG